MWLNRVYQSAYTFVSLLLIVCVVRSLKLANDFRFAKCTWDGNSCSEIKEFNRTPDEHVSEWPPGPYALPMPVDGCPESRLKGWEQGYIDFTWRDPYAVLTRNISTFEELNDNDTTVDLKDITVVQLTDMQSVIIGPYNRYRIKLNFCFKLRSDSTLDRGEWPDGSYAIYGDITGCSTGFTVEDKLIKLPKTTFWLSDGYLPYFKFNRTEEHEELRIRVCARSITWSMNSENGSLPSKEPFVLLNKNKESPAKCSTDDEMVVREVMLYLQPALPDLSNNTALLPLLAVCYYWPVKWSEDFNVLEGRSNKHFLEQDFVFTNVYISMGTVSADSYMFLSRPTEIVYNTVNAFNMMATTKIEWTIIDLGRTIPVTAIFVPYEIDVKTFTGATSIHGQDDSYCLRWEDVVKFNWNIEFTFPDESPKEADRNCRHPRKNYSLKALICFNSLTMEKTCEVFHWKKANEGFPRCFISDGKWDFLHNSALSCSYKVYYDFTVVPAGYYMQFNRIMEGRYVVLTEESGIDSVTERNVFEGNANIKVLTTKHIFGYSVSKNLPCNSDMGMSDLNIDVFGIRSSSSLPDFPTHFARPFLSGWCAEVNDTSPFIMVRFHQEVKLDGITIWNWEGTYRKVINGTVQKEFFQMGTRSFKIAFGLTENLTEYSEFKVDLLYRVNEPRYFRFYRPVHAKIVKIHDIEPLFQNMKCLRFELHGCRNTDMKQLHCTKSNDFKRYSGLITPQNQYVYKMQNQTLEACERACVESQWCTFLNLYSNGDCVQFNTSSNNNINKIWHLQDSVEGFTSAKICKSDYTQTPTMIYNVSKEIVFHVSPIFYIFAMTAVVNSESVISTIGYPLQYEYGESYKWVIQFREYEFIQFVFTNVSLNMYKLAADQFLHCDDTIKFDEERNVFGAYIRKNVHSFSVDKSYNDRIFLIDTRVYQLTVTFTSCLYHTTVDHRGRGFRAVVKKQDVPTCFTVNDFNPLSDPHHEYCDKPAMYLTSLSYNNIPFHGFTEKWNIYHNTNTFRIDVLYFDVKCDPKVSEFIFADRFTIPKTFCTLNRPPSIIYTASGSVEITFFKGNQLTEESFRLIYRTVKDLYPETITVRASSIPDLRDSVQLEGHMTKDNSLRQLFDGYEPVMPTSAVRLLHKACSVQFNKCYMIYSHPFNWDMAGNECWIRHQRLVSIRSLEELKLVKYLLRTFKMTEQYPELFENSFVHNITEYYYAYIGLRRYMDDKGKVHEMWENKSPVTYTAWKNGEPLKGDCTRMGFYLANEDMTWEATDCVFFKAFYSVCETDIGNSSIDIKDRVYVEEYKGMLNTTVKGLTCQRWDQQYPHRHIFTTDYFFPDESVQDAANFCRAPRAREKRLYCYTTDPHTETDYCYVNELQEEISPVTYTGHLDVTWKGLKCLKWPHGVTFFNETLSEASNYCRVMYSTDYYTENPGYLSCLTTVYGEEKRNFCIFKDTASDRCESTHYTYAGSWNSTVSGADCIRWNMHLSQNNFDQYAFPDKDLVKLENYCRDPTSSGFQWCYTTFPGKSWEVCKVDYGNLLNGIFGNSSASVKPMLTCKRGNKVLSYARCNGIVDCDDMSDELDCNSRLHPLFKTIASVSSVGRIPNVDSGSILLCDSLEWVSYLAHCDGIIDCHDGSDENGCDTDQFLCVNGVCVHVSLVCNFVSDCADSSDEICDFRDCDEGEYTCASGQCIASYQRCDAFEDCWDGTDENDCRSCSSTEVFNCDLVRCLPRRLLCDGYPDCEDRTDESSCDMSDITSCKEWWEAGYRETGQYIVSSTIMNGIAVMCDFTSVTSMGIIYTIFHQVDITEWEGKNVFFTRFDENDDGPFPYDDVVDFLFFSATETANFTQQIVQSCAPPLDAASKLDDISYNHTYIYCRCLNITIGIGWEPSINVIRDCGTGELLNENARDHIVFDYTYTDDHRAISWMNADIPSDSLRLQIGPVIFAEEFYSNASTFGCGEARNVFNISMQCVYDTDKAGTIIGCRSGSHLQNCKFHECPAGTVKCPNSYCIPIRFVCDGVEQCPNAEDEYECGCTDSEREVIILHEDSDFRGPDIIKLARQLHSTNGIVRSVIYKSKEISQGIPFEHRILHISDKEIKPFELMDRDYTCEYKVLANDYMGAVKFSKHKSRSLLFIQSSPESVRVASLMFSNLTKMPDFNVYRIMEGVDTRTAKSKFSYVEDVYVKNWNFISTLAARYMPEICEEATMTHCPGAYQCVSSKMCVQLQEVCDGYRHCIHGDDEFLCNFICPSECVCNGLTVTCGESEFNITGVRKFPRLARLLELTNIDIDIQLSEDLFDFPFLYLLNLSRSGIERIEKNAFSKLSNLRILDISNNKLTALSKNVFAGLQHLRTLALDGNRDISSLDPFTFEQLVAIRVLRITGTKLRTVVSNTFFGLNLEILDLQNNKIQEIQEFGLGNLAVNHIRFKGNDIQTFHKGVFTGVSSLISLQTPAYKFCCIKPNYVSEDKCFPQKDEFSSCEDLMRISALQTILWLIGLCALLGNILSIIYRLIFDRERLKLGYGIFVTNLAVADFLMGIYLIIIAVADAVFRKRYIFMDNYWRNSSWCTFAGVLSTVSSEASVMFLCLITIDRLLVIKYPFGQVRLDTRKALIISAAAWITSLFIALFPLMLSGYFQNRFYNKSGVCIALPLTRDRPPGWLYSVLVFICLNFVTFLLIAGGQWLIYREIRRSSSKLRKSKSRKKDLIVARNLLLVVATDFLCWFPIGCMGIMAMSGYVISGDVYAWAAVFILPVNSALNPLLYTLTAILGKKSFAPSTDEQARNTVHTGLGARFLVNKNIMRRRFYSIDCTTPDSYETVRECLQTFDRVPFPTVLKMTHQLAECLLVLHKNALVLKRIDENSVYVKTNQAMVIGDIQIRHEPTLRVKISDKREDVYHMGLLIKKLIFKSLK